MSAAARSPNKPSGARRHRWFGALIAATAFLFPGCGSLSGGNELCDEAEDSAWGVALCEDAKAFDRGEPGPFSKAPSSFWEALTRCERRGVDTSRAEAARACLLGEGEPLPAVLE